MNKVRQIRNNLVLHGEMCDAIYIKIWKTEVDKAVAKIRTDRIPIVFTDWTTALVNSEAEYRKDHKKNQNVISSVSSSSLDGRGGSRGGKSASRGGELEVE